MPHATVKTASPLSVAMDGATQPQPAKALGGYTPVIGERVVVLLEGARTYVLGDAAVPADPNAPPVGTVYLRSPNGTVFQLRVDNAGALSTVVVA